MSVMENFGESVKMMFKLVTVVLVLGWQNWGFVSCQPLFEDPISNQDTVCERVTLRGCECAGQWAHNQMVFTGCAKTDDKETEWCQIRPGSCKEDESVALLDRFVDGIVGRGGEPEWDYCSPGCKIPEEQLETTDDCLISTVSGCHCLQTWEFMDNLYEGCANPDSDQAGSWCIIEPQTCSEASGPVTVFPVKGLEFDYCRQDAQCQKPSPPLSPSPQLQSTQSASSITGDPITPQLQSSQNTTDTMLEPVRSTVVLSPYDPTTQTQMGFALQQTKVNETDLPPSNTLFLDAVSSIIAKNNSSENTFDEVQNDGARGTYQQYGYDESSQGANTLPYLQGREQNTQFDNDDFANDDPRDLLNDTVVFNDTDVLQALLGFTLNSTNQNQQVQLKYTEQEQQEFQPQPEGVRAEQQDQFQPEDGNLHNIVESFATVNSSSLQMLLPTVPTNANAIDLQSLSKTNLTSSGVAEIDDRTQQSVQSPLISNLSRNSSNSDILSRQNEVDDIQNMQGTLIINKVDQGEAQDVRNVSNVALLTQRNESQMLVKQPVTLSDVEEQAEDDEEQAPVVEEGIVQLNCSEVLMSSEANISLFEELMEKLGMLEELSGTVFIPTNSALQNFLGSQQVMMSDLFRFQSNLNLLQKVLNSHVIPSKSIKSMEQLRNTQRMRTLEKQTLQIRIKEGQDQVFVIPPYVEADNPLVLGQLQDSEQVCNFYGFIVDTVIIPDIIA